MLHLGIGDFIPSLLYFGGIVVFLLSVIWKPQIGLYFVVPLLPWQTARYRLHGMPLGEQFVDIIYLGIALGLLLHRKDEWVPKTPLNRIIVIFLIFYYVSLFRGSFYISAPFPLSISDPRFSDYKNYMEMMILFLLVVAAIRDVRQIKILIGCMALSFLIVNRSFYNYMSDRDLMHFSPLLRDAGPLGYAGDNGLAAFEAQFALLLLGLYSIEKRLPIKLSFLCVIATAMYCLLFSFSRGGYLGFLAGLVFMGIYRERKLLLIVLALILSWQAVVPNAVRERILMTYDEGSGLDSSAEERVSLWQDALHVFDHDPFFGTGYDTYKFMGRVGPYRDTHNMYVKVLVETGIFGMGLFLWLLWKMYRLGIELYRKSEDAFLRSLGLGFGALMVCAVTVNIFGDRWTYVQVNGYLWAVLGCVVRGLLIAHRGTYMAEEGLGPSPELVNCPPRESSA